MPRSALMIKSALAAALAFGVAGAALAQGATPTQTIPPAPPFQQAAPDPMMLQRMEEFRAARMAMMKARRALEIDRRVATVRQALELTADQQTLFKPVEDAMRGLYEAALPQHPPGAGMTLEADQRLRAMADRMRARADALGKLADAVGPFKASLNDAQKQRFDEMSRSVMAHGAMMGAAKMGAAAMMGRGGMGMHMQGHAACPMHRGMMGEQGRGAMMRHGDDQPDGRGWGWGGQQGWSEGPQGGPDQSWRDQGQQGDWRGQGWRGQGQQGGWRGDWQGQGWQGPDAEGGEDGPAEQGGAPMDHQRQTQPGQDADD